jgi:hypothetical protein
VLVAVPAAIFASCFVADVAAGTGFRLVRAAVQRRAAFGVMVTTCVIAVITASWAGGISSLRMAQAARASASQQADLRAGAWLGTHGGGQVLMEVSGNEAVAFAVPPGQVIDETSGGLWQSALRDPMSGGIRWIYMRRSDDVWNQLHGSAELSGYVRVYSSPDRSIYERHRP